MGDAGGLRVRPVPRTSAPTATPLDLPIDGLGPQPNWLMEALAYKGISRRRFLGFASAMTALLALPSTMTPQVVKALETQRKPVVAWLEFQDCAGNSESMLRSSHPTVADVVLDVLSWEYHETIMAAAGHQAEENLEKIRTGSDPYVLIVEGSIPTKDNGVYCTIGGKSAVQILEEMAANATLVIAIGACAWDGGFPRLGPTGAVGTQDVIGSSKVVNLGGCPHNPANTAATLVHFLTFGKAPELDQYNRPLFAYGHLIHDQCERRAHFDAGRFVEAWGDDGHRNGWCLYKMGCKGPQAFSNCPTTRYDEGTSWPVQAGHGCIGCHMPDFWDQMGPAYGRLPGWLPLNPDVSADTGGLALVGGIAAVAGAHGAASIVRFKRRAAAERRAAAASVHAPDPVDAPSEPAAPAVDAVAEADV
ncbi:MAG TPA: hydrogenase small subunit, partial [Candidatus Limnocylindrales bacterium]|nr:hydrogenase small subunit [Candidatus Limnocylindrales bacterium]